MSFLSRFKVITKIVAVIALLVAVAGGITWLGVTALKSLNIATDRMETSAAKALLAQGLAVNLISMNRAEWQVATDPRPESRKGARQTIDTETKLFQDRLRSLTSLTNGNADQYLTDLEAGWIKYQSEIDRTYRAAEVTTNFQMTDQMEHLRNEAASSAEVANDVRKTLRDFSDKLDKDVVNLSAAATDEYLRTSKLMIVVASIGICAGLCFGILISQYGIVKPIFGIVELLKKLASNDYNVEVVGGERKDEIGDIARAAVIFKENGIAKIEMEKEQKEVEQQTATQRKVEMYKLADEFENAVGKIIETVSSASTELESSAITLTKTAQSTQELSTIVAAASEEASANVQSVASASEEMASSVNEISRQVHESTRIAVHAVEQAQTTSGRIDALSTAATRIGDVIELINVIAGQTNLLALNATIEAARAGEAGRGFAVVASEVKALAEQTAKATGEISQQVVSIQSATQDSVNAIKDISGTIGRISEISTAIASAIEEQGSATQEIARNVQQAAQGTSEVASNIAQVQSGASETGSASTQVLSSAQSLALESNRLKLEVGKFITTVRAA